MVYNYCREYARQSMDEITAEPKKRTKRRRLKLKKLNPFRRKYKKFSEDDVVWEWDDKLNKPKKKKSRVRRFLSSTVRIITFRSLRRKRTTSVPISIRSRYGSTGSLDCLVSTDHGDNEFEPDIKSLKRSYSDSCLYQKPSDRVKKKKSTRKKVKKVNCSAHSILGALL